MSPARLPISFTATSSPSVRLLTLQPALYDPQGHIRIGLDKYLEHERAIRMAGKNRLEETGRRQAATSARYSTLLSITSDPPLVVRDVVAQLGDVRVQGRRCPGHG